MPDHEPGPQGPLLALEGAAERDPLGRACRLDAGPGDPEVADLHGVDELYPVVQRKSGKPAGTLAQTNKGFLELRLAGRGGVGAGRGRVAWLWCGYSDGSHG